MPIYKWVRDEIEKLSYVTKTEFKNAKFYIYYIKNGVETFKVLPYRADKFQLHNTIISIEKDINQFAKKRQEFERHKKPMIMHVPWVNAGETDGRQENSTHKNT